MDDHRASLVAAAFGSVAIGGFWFVRPMKPGATLRVVEQWAPISRNGPDGDAATMIRVDLRGAAREDDHPISYRIVGRDGKGYPLVPSAAFGAPGTLKLLRGYAHRLDSPRLVASRDSKTLASVSLRPIPVPERHALVQSHDSPLTLVFHGEGGLFAEPNKPVPPGERWRVVALRTPFTDGLEDVSSVLPGMPHSMRRLAVPYAEEAGLVAVELTRYRLTSESEVIRLKGLRLAQRFGGTALIVDRKVQVPNRLGADIWLPRQYNGPRHPVHHGDTRIAMANVVMTPKWMSNLAPDLGRGRGPRIEILRPAPEDLGLRELRIGFQPRLGRPKGPVREGPFEATVRVTFFRPIPIETRRLVLPVIFGPPLPHSQTPFGSDPSFAHHR